MKILLLFLIFITFSNNLYSETNLNRCDKILKKSKKIECLTKLKAVALKDGSKKKLNLIQEKLTILHNKIGDGAEKTEKTIFKAGKKIGEGASASEKNIKKGAKKIYKDIKSLGN